MYKGALVRHRAFHQLMAVRKDVVDFRISQAGGTPFSG
jgi:hypothetical protein